MERVREVKVRAISPEPLMDLIAADRRAPVEESLGVARGLLAGRTLWTVNSTSSGGGVAEMLWAWVEWGRGLALPVRWLTIARTPEFFLLTKRLHSRLYGEAGDGGDLGTAERNTFEQVSEVNAEVMIPAVNRGDVVLLHDPQTAGLIPHFARAGCTVVWRCHIGTEETSDHCDDGWKFLAPYLQQADACVFYRDDYVPDLCRETQIETILPAINPLSAKNQKLEQSRVEAILHRAGLLSGPPPGSAASFTRSTGATGSVERRCNLMTNGRPPEADAPLVVQVSRWDRLKDPVGVMQGFAKAPLDDAAHLVLAGPTLGVLSGGGPVLEEARKSWRSLPTPVRDRVHLASLPVEDREENAAIVNALQRQASIVVQKSLKEGFGLTVTEAMWKERPVIASDTGGIRNQVRHGLTGVLLPDPRDLDAFGVEIGRLLKTPALAERMGAAAHQSVRRSFLVDRPALQYVELLGRLLT